jgi:threonine dehydrogenase-like Zn-dependent dehydrogenase
MKALWLEDRKLRLRDDVARPAPPPGEALIRVLAAGICNTDIELTRGYYPFSGIPGHEFVGMVEEGPSSLRGKRVVGEINASCHECAMCRAGHPTHCERRTVLGIANRNGAFAEYLTLPAVNLHIVPDALANDVAVFTEPLAAALEIQEQIEIGPKDRVLVVGDGKLAQLIVRTLVTTGCQVTAVGRHEKKRKLLEAAGARITEEILPRTFDVTVECSGNADGFALARKGVRPRGTIVMKSTYAGELSFNASALVVDEITLVGSRCGPFAPALKMLEDSRVDVRPLVEATYPLSDALAAFEHAQRPGVLKVLITSS